MDAKKGPWEKPHRVPILTTRVIYSYTHKKRTKCSVKHEIMWIFKKSENAKKNYNWKIGFWNDFLNASNGKVS